MYTRSIEDGVYVPRDKADLLEVLYDDAVTRDATWYRLEQMIKDPSFSITQMKEYQPDLWSWVIQACHAYWDSRSAKK